MKFIKENLRVFIAVCIALVLIVAGVILLLVNDDKNDLSKEQEQKEETLTEVTGMSGDDAIEIVKQHFNGNNYEFVVEITSDSLYKVTAVSKFDNSTITYFVDPVTGKAYIDIDTN